MTRSRRKTSPLIARVSTGFLQGILLALSLSLSASALAWNAAGHRLVASIAWDHLRPEVREGAARLLRAHPEYARWLKRGEGENPDRIAFIEASTWADEIRKDKRFYSAGLDEPTPGLAGYPDMERRRSWHYVNRPLDGKPGQTPISGLLDKQLVALAGTLGSSSVPVGERVYALPWLIHLTGDAHQPLHTSVRLDAEGKWDKLRNELKVNNPFNSRKSLTTLHAYWDDLPGPPWLRGERLDTASQALTSIHPRPKRSKSSQQWIEESWRIARESAYPEGKDEIPTITEAFFRNTREIADRRITEAGYRLADLLNQLLTAERRAE